MSSQPRIHITGASGAGTSTLGHHLARALDVQHLDTDDFYWLPTQIPFTQKRPPADRVRLMKTAQGKHGWVLSGSLMGWGEPAIKSVDLVVYLSLPQDVRMARLKARERRLYSDRIGPGGDMHASHQAFMAWARRYEDPEFEGRSRARHQAWLETLQNPVLPLDSNRAVAALIKAVKVGLADAASHSTPPST